VANLHAVLVMGRELTNGSEFHKVGPASLSWRFSPKSGFRGTWGRKYFGSPPKTIHNHISWESTLVASLVNIGGRLRSVERSTRFM